MPATFRCQYCSRALPTRAGVSRHVANTPACREKWTQNLGAITVARDEAEIRPETPEVQPQVADDMDDPMNSPMERADNFVPPPRAESPPPPELAPQSRRATVEEVLDEDDPQYFRRFVEAFPGDEEDHTSAAGIPLRPGETLFERMRREQETTGDSKFAPFAGGDEWDLARWLSKNVSQTATDEYLQLPINKKAKLSFHNNRAFLQKIDALPTGPDWTCEIVTVAGNRLDENDKIMSEELELWKRDPVECIKELMSNPAFKNHMAYEPEKLGLRKMEFARCTHLSGRSFPTLTSSDASRPTSFTSYTKASSKTILSAGAKSFIGKDELDARFKAVNGYPGLRHFKKGISSVSQWTGTEHKEMQRVFVGVLAGAVNAKVLTVVKALIDFIYYAQLQSHTTRTLDALQKSLDAFHDHKQIIIDLGVREHFNIPKFHAIQHYVDSIRSLGSPDGYNTESPERLHIDFAKKAYRASNRRDYVEQMALWLQRQEAVALPVPAPAPDSSDSDDEDLDEEQITVSLPSTSPKAPPLKAYTIAKRPTTINCTVAHFQIQHGAADIIPALTAFLKVNFKSCPVVPGPFDRFDLYNKITLHLPANRYLSKQPRTSRIRAVPAVPAKERSRGSPAIFDTALVVDDPSQYVPSSGIDGLRPAQVRAIFSLPPQFGSFPHPLAYVEWFTPLNRPDPVSGMYTTHRSTASHRRRAGVVSVEHLIVNGPQLMF
ncbi:hypothetical protein B0H17DRAFT_1179726 [Mycena rosella]|uniref:C2H2-type domain-containing protein n=1 Tax=Mycena rosella TaxID=1033263 RepID=A0AAD7DG85_MYCRO|nr:hypothetical protein B0H17DRAFT_1179726 [Mycena rosella]